MPNTYTQKASWPYTFDEATLDRRTGRESVRAPMCSKLQGIDGNHEGGLRPFPGFRQIEDGASAKYELDFYGNGENHTATITSASSPNTGGTFTLTVTVPEHATVTTPQTTAAIAFDATVAAIKTALEALSNVGTSDIDVTASGSGTDLGDADTELLFTFQNGLTKQPIVFSADLSGMTGGDPATFATTNEGEHDHDTTSNVNDFFPVTFLKESNDFCRGFVYRAQGPSGGTTSDILIDFWDSSTGTWTSGTRLMSRVSNTEPMNVTAWGRYVYVSIRGESCSVFYYDAGASAFQVDSPAGPGKRIPIAVENGISSATPVPDTSTSLLTGEVGHATVVLLDNDNSANLPADQQSGGDEPAVLLDAGTYSVAIRLLDSGTGRRSGISEIGEVFEETFTSDGSAYEQNYVGVRIVWDTTKYDKAEIFRSVKVENLGTTMGARIIHSVKTITLADYQYDVAAYPSGNYDQALYFFELNDVATSWQTPYMDNRLFDEEVPNAGASVIIDNTFFLSNITNVGNSLSDEETETDKDRRVGQIRWSSTVELSPELFSPQGYYNLQNPGSEVIALTNLAGNALGFSKDRQFHIRREGRYIRVHELHHGYGITGPHAHETVADMCYFMTDKGLKSVGANGQLDDVRSVNRIILKEWNGQLDDVTMAIDGSQSCLYILNPTAQQAICLWFNTAKVSTLIDMSFTQCRSGYWPIDEDTSTQMYQLEPRAFFLQNAPRDSATDTITGWKPRIWIPDYRRQRTLGGGSGSSTSRVTMLGFTGDSRFSTSADVDSSGVISLSTSGGLSMPTAKLEGAWVYVLNSTTTSLIGAKAQIHDVSGTDVQLTSATKANLLNLPSGSRIGISPVPFEVVAAPLDQRAETGEVTGYSRHHVRHVDSMGVFLSELGGYPTTDSSNDARCRGLLYKTEGVSAPLTAHSYDETGSIVANMREGEMTRWNTFGDVSPNSGQSGVEASVFCPGFSTFVPDLDYVLLSMVVDGKMQATSTTEEPSR